MGLSELKSTNENIGSDIQNSKNFDRRVEKNTAELQPENRLNAVLDKRIDSEAFTETGSLEKTKNIFDIPLSSLEKTQKDVGGIENGYDVKSEIFQEYIGDIKRFTGFDVPKESLKKIDEFMKNHEIKQLSPEQVFERRKEFSANKNELIKKWENETGQEWPRYDQDVKNSAGNIVRRKGSLYDAHHVIELSYGGPPESWNIVPAKYPDEHQNGIHQCESTKKLFPHEKVYDK